MLRNPAEPRRVTDPERPDQITKKIAQLSHSILSDPAGPICLNLLYQLARRLVDAPALLGSPYQKRPPIARIWHPLEISVSFQVVDQVADCLLGRADSFGQLGDTSTLDWQPLEDRVVGRPDLVQSRLRKARLDSTLKFVVRDRKQRADQG